MDSELETYHQTNAELDEAIGQLRSDVDELQGRVAAARRSVKKRTTFADKFRGNLEEVAQTVLEPEGVWEELH